MPYFLYKISSPPGPDLVRKLELLEVFDGFRAAKETARQLRSQNSATEFTYKVMFADNQLSAEEQLLEKRERPVLMEHER